MQFLHDVFFRIGFWAGSCWKRISTNLPLRLTAGRFGIWLCKIGRALQVRYANWNAEFRLKHEYHSNSDLCTLHVSEVVTDCQILTFESRNSQLGKRTPMVDALFNIRGVAKVTLVPYEVDIRKAHVFSWREILPSVEKVLLEHLT